MASLREQMAVVNQEPRLFSLTVGENIAYGWPADVPLTQVGSRRVF